MERRPGEVRAPRFSDERRNPVAAPTPTHEFTAVARPGPAAGTARRSEAQPELEDSYLVALAKRGSSDAYDRIVRRYRGFVRLKASSYFLLGGDSDDLIQEGLLGLYKSIRDFRSDRESSFRNFAELCITR
ncbi:MAG: sigma factor, partial [Solirubrobacterales bacterium]